MRDVSIDFTFDEIRILCDRLGLDLPVGVAPPDVELPPQISERLNAAALSTLMARGIIADPSGSEVNDAVAALLDLASKPGLVVAVEVQREGLVDLSFLLCDVDLGVAVSALAPSLYRLVPFVTRDIVHRVVLATDLRPAEVPSAAPVSLTRADIDRAVEVADGGHEATVTLLRELGAEQESAVLLADALTELRGAVTITALHQSEDDLITGGVISWLDAGLAGNWLCDEPDEPEPEIPGEEGAVAEDETLIVRPAAAKEILATFLSFLPPAFSE